MFFPDIFILILRNRTKSQYNNNNKHFCSLFIMCSTFTIVLLPNSCRNLAVFFNFRFELEARCETEVLTCRAITGSGAWEHMENVENKLHDVKVQEDVFMSWWINEKCCSTRQGRP